MTTMNGPLALRHLESGHDPTGMGRYSYQSIVGRNNTKILFITAYRVCFQDINSAGVKTSFFQQWHHLRINGHAIPNPRQQILEDLKTFIHESIKEGCDVCLAMDANEDSDSQHQKLNNFAGECGLVNAHELFFDEDYYEDHPLPAMFMSGTKKIDHMFCTPRLFDCIVGVSIEPLSSGIKSDHRALIVDFDTEAMLGSSLSSIAKNSTRILKSYSKKASRNYRNELDNRLAKQNIYERVEKLSRKYERKKGFDEKMHRDAETIDQYITKCMLKCERMINTAQGDNFSPRKKKAADTAKFWALALSALNHQLTTPTPPMKIIMERHPEIDFSQYDDEEIIRDRIKSCIETSRQTKQNAYELRQAFLEERADIAKQNGNLSLEAAICQIQNIESTRRNFAIISKIMERNQFKKGLSMIKVRNESTGDYETVVNAGEIEKLLLQRNQNHYAQANGTFMATSEMRGNIGPSGTSKFCDKILSGEIDSQAYPVAVQAIFKELSKPNSAAVNDVISLEDFKDAMRRWKESTSTSPSGRHLGHYISLLTKIGDDTDVLGEKILNLHHKMLVIAQYRGRPYERWKSEVEIMLEKEPGNPKIERLRIICLYKADYNLFLKIMWAHRLVTVAEEQNLFDDCQGGGRPNRTSNDVAVRKMLTYAYSRVTRTNFACMDLDAKSCYDRIVASFALLCSRRFGMPKTACDIHGITIDQMKHYVKTALGISKAFF
jgi:hypothetical protein